MKKLLEKVRELQTKFPDIVLGGSCALYIYGATLSRFEIANCDIDLITPRLIDFPQKVGEETKFKGSNSSDFTLSQEIDGIKIEQCIDSEMCRHFQIQNFEDFSYKVFPLERILYYKIKYALEGNNKHRNDIYELLVLPRPQQLEVRKIVHKETVNSCDDLPF